MSLPFSKIGMDKVFKGFRQLGPDTIVGAKYIKRNEGSFERKRADLHSYKKAKAIETANRFCTTCGKLASQIAVYSCRSVTIMERYCQACIDANKHLKDNELMDNFDSLFIKAEPGSPIYEQVHAKNREE